MAVPRNRLSNSRKNTKRSHHAKKPKGFTESKVIAKQGGTIAGNARKQIEEKTGKEIVSKTTAKKLIAAKKRNK